MYLDSLDPLGVEQQIARQSARMPSGQPGKFGPTWSRPKGPSTNMGDSMNLGVLI